jgi:hypothetical protein
MDLFFCWFAPAGRPRTSRAQDREPADRAMIFPRHDIHRNLFAETLKR